MSEQRINPYQVTKPIQLLAAWLVGLILIDASFLGAAKIITVPAWAPGLLVIAAILNVPAFLTLIFFLQTKFRAELQEDTYYSKHLEKVTGQAKERTPKMDQFIEHIKKIEMQSNNQFQKIEKNLEELTASLCQISLPSVDIAQVLEKVEEAKLLLSELEQETSFKIAINDLLPHYKDILKQLILDNFTINQTFGSTSKDKVPPKTLTITCTKAIRKEVLVRIYSILKSFGFNRIDINDEPMPFDEADIYIGSYIDNYESSKSVEIDTEIESMLLDTKVSMQQLSEYIKLSRSKLR